MAKIIRRIIYVLVVCIVVLVTSINVKFVDIFSLPDDVIVSYDDINFINENRLFGSFINASVGDVQTSVDKERIGKLTFRLFGVIPLKTIDVEVNSGMRVYLGGVPIGFSLDIKGLIVLGDNFEDSQDYNIKTGDIIVKANEIEVLDKADLKDIIENSEGNVVHVEILRNGEKIEQDIVPKFEQEAECYKLGVWVKDDASGVGTITFIDTKTKRFGALGHAITDFETGTVVPVESGKIYKCSIIGINKAEKGKPGDLKCLFMQSKSSCKGEVEKNSKYGVYGKIEDSNEIIDENLTAEVGSRITVKPGKASIVSSISGVREEYEVEIIKASYQPSSSDKSMVFRVTDRRLLEKTGGILQGMSGSPIMQNGKIIGAVTHVFLNDPTKGYGVYIDWMIDE